MGENEEEGDYEKDDNIKSSSSILHGWRIGTDDNVVDSVDTDDGDNFGVGNDGVAIVGAGPIYIAYYVVSGESSCWHMRCLWALRRNEQQ